MINIYKSIELTKRYITWNNQTCGVSILYEHNYRYLQNNVLEATSYLRTLNNRDTYDLASDTACGSNLLCAPTPTYVAL